MSRPTIGPDAFAMTCLLTNQRAVRLGAPDEDGVSYKNGTLPLPAVKTNGRSCGYFTARASVSLQARRSGVPMGTGNGVHVLEIITRVE